MNEYMILGFIIIVTFISYRKYTQYQVLKLVPSLLEQGGQIIDVRTKKEFAQANKKGSINIPIEELQTNLKKINKTKPIILCCASGSRSALAKRTLISKGFENVHNAGAWASLMKF
jgi:phage shock protein E